MFIASILKNNWFLSVALINLLNLHDSSKNVFVNSMRFFTYTSTSSVNRNRFLLFSLFCFTSLYWLGLLVHGEKWWQWTVLLYSMSHGEYTHYFPWILMLAAGFVNAFHQVNEVPFLFLVNYVVFIMKRCWILSSSFSALIDIIIWIFILFY